jgi:hypothetical protein
MRHAMLAAGLVLALGSSALAQQGGNRFAMVGMNNATDLHITYAIKWGENGLWETYTLAPGEARWHAWEYDFVNQNRSPIPYVEFDYDLSDGALYRTYHLEAYASPVRDINYAKIYEFAPYDYGRLLDLYATN